MPSRGSPPAPAQRAMLKGKEHDHSGLSREREKAKKTGEAKEQARGSEEASKSLRKGGKLDEERRQKGDGKQKGSPTQGEEDGEAPRRGRKKRDDEKLAKNARKSEVGKNDRTHVSKDDHSSIPPSQEVPARKPAPRSREADERIQTAGKSCEMVQFSASRTPETPCRSAALLPLPVSPYSRSLPSSSSCASSLSCGLGLLSPAALVAIERRTGIPAHRHDAENRLPSARSKRAHSKEKERPGTGKSDLRTSGRKPPLIMSRRRGSPSSRPLPTSVAASSTSSSSSPLPVAAVSSAPSSSAASGSSSSGASCSVDPFRRNPALLSAAAFLATGGWDPLSDDDSGEELSSQSDDACSTSKGGEGRVSLSEDAAVSPRESRKEGNVWLSDAWGDPWSDHEGRGSSQKDWDKKADGTIRNARQQKAALNRGKRRKGWSPAEDRLGLSLLGDFPPALGSVYLQRAAGCASLSSQVGAGFSSFPSAFSCASSSSCSSSSSVSVAFSTPLREAFASLSVVSGAPDDPASMLGRRSEQKYGSSPSPPSRFPRAVSRHTASSAPFGSCAFDACVGSSAAYPPGSHVVASSLGRKSAVLPPPPSLPSPGEKESVVQPPPPPPCFAKQDAFRSPFCFGSSSRSATEERRPSSGVPPPPKLVENALSPPSLGPSAQDRFRQPALVVAPVSLQRHIENEAHHGRGLSFSTYPCPTPLDTGEAHPSLPPIASYPDEQGTISSRAFFSSVYPVIPSIALYGTEHYASCPPSFYEEDAAASLPPSTSSLVFPPQQKHIGKARPLPFSSSLRPSPLLPARSFFQEQEHEASRLTFVPSHASGKKGVSKDKCMQLFVVPCLSWCGGRYFSPHRCVSSAPSFDAFPVG
ncbi:conserved hypothetical protein [Neospora caninum Liverpool]|uniref:Uncharacterized protein n=1 Tax=Neospora caninum (strain Liverpool) TaxID=572307 RepID=F0VD48_NEOCL|nr:conserved hypothetical protein [Neospora caninum Liverpool]CBZ51563.1 conserved hypothetical protein [Neospora caninum Liverpool]CEL65514.1 TPA: hypothetical protein BN1204_013560 [Neospora caninum Liverpool]|eukprot:XP_003881596.1 conserved hypothetical protein [Neospora caninum Liverpool]